MVEAGVLVVSLAVGTVLVVVVVVVVQVVDGTGKGVSEGVALGKIEAEAEAREIGLWIIGGGVRRELLVWYGFPGRLPKNSTSSSSSSSFSMLFRVGGGRGTATTTSPSASCPVKLEDDMLILWDTPYGIFQREEEGVDGFRCLLSLVLRPRFQQTTTTQFFLRHGPRRRRARRAGSPVTLRNRA